MNSQMSFKRRNKFKNKMKTHKRFKHTQIIQIHLKNPMRKLLVFFWIYFSFEKNYKFI
jgi:hypothetical protein